MTTTSIDVPAALDGERLDRAICLITGVSRASVAALIGAGRVRIGGRRVTSRSERVHVGARLEFELDEAIAPLGVVAEEVAFGVVHEDPAFVVVDKPAGLAVHPGAGRNKGTLAGGLLARYPDLAALTDDGPSADRDRPGIVHRLDKDTSGLLVVARTADALAALSAQMKARTAHRGYVALTRGHFIESSGTIDAPIGRSTRDRKNMAVVADGRVARSHYRVREMFSKPDVTLLDVELDTGRTHQIRVHLAAVGRPVAGDRRYGGRTEPAFGRRLGLERPFLHAARLRFEHPVSEEQVEFESPLPPDLAAALDRLRDSPRR